MGFLLIENTIAQKHTHMYKKGHFLSQEEMDNYDVSKLGKDFFPTDPPEAPVHNIAEFERMKSVLIRYNGGFGIPMSLIVEMAEDCNVTTIVANTYQENAVKNLYSEYGIDLDHCDFLIAPSDSYWTRDYGPWFVINGYHDFGIVNFPYNRPSRPDDDDIPIELADYMNIYLYGMDLIQTGGNYMTDGLGVAAQTDLVWDENPSLTHDEIDSLVYNYLGIETLHVVPDPLGEYIKHIDCWGKFLDVDKVLIGQVPSSDPRYDDFEYVANYFAQQQSSYGNNYTVYRIYTPGTYPYTPYTNSLILNKKVFVPVTGHSADEDALEVYEDAMPGYEIIGVYHTTWENTDALHCRTKGIADTGMLYIKHFPLWGEVLYQKQYEISAIIHPYSDEQVIDDSLLIYYKVDSGNYQTVKMQQVFGYKYNGFIPEQEPESEVSYYISAADESGRSAKHPFIGSPDPHVFEVGIPETDITVLPDSLLFYTVDQALYGQIVTVYNYEDEIIIIEDITEEGYDAGFHWYIEPWNIELPYELPAGDSLELNVKIAIVADDDEMFYDTLFVETETRTHKTIIGVDEWLVNRVKDKNAKFENLRIYPNPFDDEVNISFKLLRNVHTRITVTDVLGNTINVLTDNILKEGLHEISWNGENASGNELKSGVYFIMIKAGEKARMQKVVKTN